MEDKKRKHENSQNKQTNNNNKKKKKRAARMVQEMPEARKSCSPFYCLWARDVYVCVCMCVCMALWAHTSGVQLFNTKPTTFLFIESKHKRRSKERRESE